MQKNQGKQERNYMKIKKKERLYEDLVVALTEQRRVAEELENQTRNLKNMSKPLRRH